MTPERVEELYIDSLYHYIMDNRDRITVFKDMLKAELVKEQAKETT